jgi:hypothetical protein
MRQFSKSVGCLSVQEIAANLGTTPSVIEGMLDTLVRLGKLEEIENGMCEECPFEANCINSLISGRAYILKSPQRLNHPSG